MNNGREQLIAYLATLFALVLIVIGGMTIAAIAEQVLGKMEAFGLGTVTGGLIGVLKIPSQRSVTVDNSPTDPVPTQDAAP